VAWLLLSVMAVSAGVASAQDYADTTSVVVVEVPVHVTRNGEPVPGLTADNFEVLDEGKRQSITGFDVIDLREPMSASDAQMMGASARRHFIFVFDLTFSEPGAIVKARQAARDLVRTSLHPTDLVAVATYSNRTGPQMILSFTTDRRQVEEAFATLGLIRQKRRIDDPLGIVMRSPAIADELAEDEESTADERTGIDADAEVRLAIETIVGESSRADVRRRVNIFAGTFGFLADMLAPLDGRKHVVFLSQGFDASWLFGTMDQERIAEIQDAVEQGEIWNVDDQERYGDTQALSSMNELLNQFQQADASIHAIDIGRLTAGQEGANARGRRDSLSMLSSETGGEFYRNYNDLSEAMGEMLERTSVTYVLAFQPSDLRRGDVDFRRLRVRLEDVPRGTRVVHREGYFPPRSFADLSEAQQKLQTAQQMATGVAPGGLELDVLTMPFGAGAGPAYVPLLVQIPGRELVSSTKGELPLELYAYATDENGEVADYFGESLTFDLSQVGASLATTGLRFFGHLDLDPGAYAVRVMVKDKRSGATAVEVVPLQVPEFDQVHLAVMPPLVPEGVDRWVSVRESPERAALRSVDYPFLFKTQPFVPAVRPVFQPEQVVAVSLVALTSGSGPLEVSSLILAEDGAPLPGTFLRVLERESASQSGLERLIAAFEVPNLPGGNYALVVTMSDPGSGEVESGSLEFSLGQRSTAGIFSAPDWMPDLSEIVGQLGPADPEVRIVKIDKQAVAEAYEQVLRLLADGRQMSAVLALAELEAGVVNKDNPMSTLNQTAKVQDAVLARVSRSDPDLLLPAILLHKEAYSQYRIRKESFLSVHARTTALGLIDEYVKRSKTQEARELASRIITGMVPEVYESGAHVSAMSMLRRAIELDVRNAAALTGLGFLLETTGREDRVPTYEDAVAMFERAIRVQPELHEARLRLGVNLGRLGRGLESGRQLNRLIEAEDVPDWISSLAYQELARLYLQSGQCDEARRVLERGRERMPEESKLALQLSYAYERCQRQAQAKRAIRAAEGGGTAARYLYLQVPQAIMAFSGGPWRERAESQLPALAAALGPARMGVGG
jgi:VWFA-related protein